MVTRRRACEEWCSSWTLDKVQCKGCTDCDTHSCRIPKLFAGGFDGSPNAGFAAAYGTATVGSSGSLSLVGNSRAYLVEDMARGGMGSAYKRLNLLGKRLRFTADVSQVPCSTIAAFYFVSMDAAAISPGGYCDILSDPWCTEVDIFEANGAAIQATIHTQRGTGPDGTCNECECPPLQRA